MTHILICTGDCFGAMGLELLLGQICTEVQITRLRHPKELSEHLDPNGKEVVVISLAAVPDALDDLDRNLAGILNPPGVLVLAPAATPPAVLLNCVRPGRGFLLDGSHPDMLRHALEAVAAGKSFSEPTLTCSLLAAFEEQRGDAEAMRRIDPEGVLAQRMRKVVLLAARGYGAGEVAKRLYKSETTVRSYLHEAYELLGIRNRNELIRRYQGDTLSPVPRRRRNDDGRRLLAVAAEH